MTSLAIQCLMPLHCIKDIHIRKPSSSGWVGMFDVLCVCVCVRACICVCVCANSECPHDNVHNVFAFIGTHTCA